MLKVIAFVVFGLGALFMMHVGARGGLRNVTKRSAIEILGIGSIAFFTLFAMSGISHAAGSSSRKAEEKPLQVISEQTALIHAKTNVTETANEFGDRITSWTKCKFKGDKSITVVAGQTGPGSYVFSSYKKIGEDRFEVYKNAGVTVSQLAECD